jgi:hypothetical protein
MKERSFGAVKIDFGDADAIANNIATLDDRPVSRTF